MISDLSDVIYQLGQIHQKVVTLTETWKLSLLEIVKQKFRKQNMCPEIPDRCWQCYTVLVTFGAVPDQTAVTSLRSPTAWQPDHTDWAQTRDLRASSLARLLEEGKDPNSGILKVSEPGAIHMVGPPWNKAAQQKIARLLVPLRKFQPYPRDPIWPKSYERNVPGRQMLPSASVESSNASKAMYFHKTNCFQNWDFSD